MRIHMCIRIHISAGKEEWSKNVNFGTFVSNCSPLTSIALVQLLMYLCCSLRYNEWVHVNCGLWSSEVYETMDGSLINVTQVEFLLKEIPDKSGVL